MDVAVVEYGSCKTRPSALLNSIFMTTVKAAAKSLVAVASNAKATDQQSHKWRATDHMRFMLMLMTWLAVWVLRVLMDHSPFSTASLDDLMMLPSIGASSSFDLVLQQDSSDHIQPPPSAKALGRALTHVSSPVLIYCFRPNYIYTYNSKSFNFYFNQGRCITTTSLPC